jgi:FkbM family methyltransferase
MKLLKLKYYLALLKGRMYDRQTAAVLKKVLKKDAICIDVGCHKGEILDAMVEHAPAGKFFGFEPIPDLYNKLVDKYRQDGRVSISPVALSDKPGIVSFQHVVGNPAFSGFLRRQYLRSDELVETIEVKTDLLDRILSTDTVVNFMKIDVEGAELGVLRGAEQVIRRSRPYIIFEHGLGASEYYGTTPDNMYDFLVERCGMNISLMSRFLRRKLPFTREEFRNEFDSGRNFYFIAYS